MPRKQKATPGALALLHKTKKQLTKVCCFLKEFREDLYYRLNVFEIELPPLRERKQELKTLVQKKIDFLNGKTIGEGFWEVIDNYDWPGNVRQLISVLKRAGFLESEVISGTHIQDIIQGSSRKRYNKTKIQVDENSQL